MTDDQKTIAKKIKSHAFSGGGASREEHEANGGNPDIDVAYQYLSFFEDNDEKMESLAKVSVPHLAHWKLADELGVSSWYIVY